MNEWIYGGSLIMEEEKIVNQNRLPLLMPREILSSI